MQRIWQRSLGRDPPPPLERDTEIRLEEQRGVDVGGGPIALKKNSRTVVRKNVVVPARDQLSPVMSERTGWLV